MCGLIDTHADTFTQRRLFVCGARCKTLTYRSITLTPRDNTPLDTTSTSASVQRVISDFSYPGAVATEDRVPVRCVKGSPLPTHPSGADEASCGKIA